VVLDGSGARGDRSLHLPLSVFSAQLDWLQARCDVVPLSALLTPDDSSERPRVAITFDDAYRGAVTTGIGELARRGLPATIFVAPGLLGDHPFWWDQAAESSNAPEVPHALRERALGPCQGRADVIRRDWAELGLRFDATLPAGFRSATETELAHAASLPGVSLGAHSWSHPNLAALDDQLLREELDRPREWLAQCYPNRTLPCLAYPYGLHDAKVRSAAGAAGYVAGFRVDGGWFKQHQGADLQTPRLNIPSGISQERFRIYLSALPWL
jgi:peptidoglycan/xylan/chitin deacetylase (PgdA/CDA1 family)